MRPVGFRLATTAAIAAIVGVLPGISAAGLVSYWNFDEATAGTTPALDLVGGNDGTFMQSAAHTTGLIGAGAARFNNVAGLFAGNVAGDGVNVGVGTGMSPAGGVTVEALVRSEWEPTLVGAAPDAPGYPNYDTIFRREDAVGSDDRLLLALQNDGHNAFASPPVPEGPVLSFGLMVGGEYRELDMPLDGADGRPSLADLTSGAAHHVVATYDAATGLKAIYFDGALRWSTIESGPVALTVTGSTMIGENPHVGIEPFAGVIDEVAFYDTALPPTDVAKHYANVLAGQNYFVPEPGGALISVATLIMSTTIRRRRR
jgi:hypothetical protein